MKKKRKIIILVLIILTICVAAWFGYRETSRPTTPVIAIENNIVTWTATGTGDIRAGRFIRQYEVRVIIGDETFTAIIEGATEVGATMTKDLKTFILDDAQPNATNAEVTVRTIRNLDSGTRFSHWSNTVTWALPSDR